MQVRFVHHTALLAGLVLAAPSAVSAQSPSSQDDPYVAIKLAVGVQGSVDVDSTVAGVTVSANDDLEPSFGAGMAYMHPLHRYFVLGGQLSLLSWQTQSRDNANLDRNLLADLTVVPQGRLPVSDDIELTLGLPLGLALDFWGDDQVAVGVGGASVVTGDVGPGVGFTFGLMLGARFAVSRSVGLLVELGYVAHNFTHTVDTTVGPLTNSTDVDFAAGQPLLQVGVSF